MLYSLRSARHRHLNPNHKRSTCTDKEDKRGRLLAIEDPLRGEAQLAPLLDPQLPEMAQLQVCMRAIEQASMYLAVDN